MHIKSLFFLLVIAITISTNVYGQFNIKIGYNTQFPALYTTNELFKKFNDNKNVTVPYKNFRFMHGLDLGVRYFLTRGLAAEASFTNNFSSDNKSIRKDGSQLIEDEWRLTNRTISLGLDSYFGWIGIGGHIQQSRWSYAKDIEGINGKQIIYKENDYMLKINAIIYSQSDKTAIALKPFYSFPISGDSKDITEVNKVLNGSTSSDKKLEDFSHFGLTIVFYNGPQRK